MLLSGNGITQTGETSPAHDQCPGASEPGDPPAGEKVGIFPSEEAVLRLIGVVLVEIYEAWATGHRYLDMTSTGCGEVSRDRSNQHSATTPRRRRLNGALVSLKSYQRILHTHKIGLDPPFLHIVVSINLECVIPFRGLSLTEYFLNPYTTYFLPIESKQSRKKHYTLRHISNQKENGYASD